MQKKIDTLLVGLGSVGLNYDLVVQNHVLTHAKSLFLNKRINLISGVDVNKKKLNLFQKKYGLKSFKNLNKALNFANYELAVISVSTNNLSKVFNMIKNHKTLKYILIEKPGSSSLKEFIDMVQYCSKKKIKLFINYNRSFFNPLINEFNFLKNCKNFKIIHTYSRGLYNNGSHFLNLVLSFLKLPNKIQIIDKKKNYKDDIYSDIFLKFRNGTIFLCSNNNKTLVNETAINFDNKKIFFDLNNNEFIKFNPESSKLVKGFKQLKEVSNKRFKIKYNQKLTLNRILKNLNNNFFIKKRLLADFKTFKVLDKIKRLNAKNF